MRALFCKVIFTWNFTLNHMEFNVKWNGSGWHIQWLSTSQITWSCSESIKIWNNYYKNTFWPQTRQIFSRGISHWITWNSMWNEMVSDGLMAHTVGLHIIEYFNLSGNHKNSKQLSWEHFFCRKSENVFTWNSMWNENVPKYTHPVVRGHRKY